MLDEPHGTEDTLYKATGGWIAAPVVGKVIRRIGPMLGVVPEAGIEERFQDLILIGNKRY